MRYDVAVIGGGNAALCAALEARQRGASVVLLERAPRLWRGGNSKYTRNLRCAHGADPLMPGEYEEDEFLEDLVQVALDAPIDLELARLLVRESRLLPEWMAAHEVHWQRALTGTLSLARTNRFFLGGGKALVNTYYRVAGRSGVEMVYGADVTQLRFADGLCKEAVIHGPGGDEPIRAGTFVVACGGFEANREWLAEVWGEAASRFVIRGCTFNDGAVAQQLLELGVQPAGVKGAFHATAVDARAPDFDGGIVTRVDSVPFGIVVNQEGERFFDEGEELWPKRYAIWGRLIAEQPNQTAFSIYDHSVAARFIPPLYEPISAPSIEILADALEVPREQLTQTVKEFNAAAQANVNARQDLAILDGLATAGVSPPKSNWALPLNTPPFYAFPLRPGITFTYFGVRVNEESRVVRENDTPVPNVFAAGEVMAGNILKSGYLAGVGMTLGTVFGRIAGSEAAAYALR